MPKVKITSQGTKYVDVEELRASPTVQETLRLVAEKFGHLPGSRKAGDESKSVPESSGRTKEGPPSQERG